MSTPRPSPFPADRSADGYADAPADQSGRRAYGGAASGRERWARRPRRSGGDRKVAGVAGGIGRAVGVDPVIIRVAFVLLTIFGGSGILLYLLGWLLLPADGDEVSAVEALIGRGRSSTPPILTLVLTIITVVSLGSVFSLGFPFLPLVIGAFIALSIGRKRRQTAWQSGRAGYPGVAAAPGPWASGPHQQGGCHGFGSWGAQAEQWVARQAWSGPPSGKTGATADAGPPASPFETPAFWDAPHPGGPTTNAPSGVRLTKDGPAGPPITAQQPPAWDPLGAAPFAWDLPEPTPLVPAPAARRPGVVGRVTLGATLLVGGLLTAGILAGWWPLSLAAASATALAVLAIGLFVGSLRGRGAALIGPGIFLSVLTLGLTITGLDTTSAYGQQSWAPTSPATLSGQYVLNGGQGQLDLRGLTVPEGQDLRTAVTVRAGEASVIVPADARLNVTCSTNAGEIDCLGSTLDGIRQETTVTENGSAAGGTLTIDVHVGAGRAEVRHG